MLSMQNQVTALVMAPLPAPVNALPVQLPTQQVPFQMPAAQLAGPAIGSQPLAVPIPHRTHVAGPVQIRSNVAMQPNAPQLPIPRPQYRNNRKDNSFNDPWCGNK